jgi:hypothetical protein
MCGSSSLVKDNSQAFVAKSALTLAYSCAATECGLPIIAFHKDILAFSEKTIIAERLVKDAFHLFDVPLTLILQ